MGQRCCQRRVGCHRKGQLARRHRPQRLHRCTLPRPPAWEETSGRLRQWEDRRHPPLQSTPARYCSKVFTLWFGIPTTMSRGCPSTLTHRAACHTRLWCRRLHQPKEDPVGQAMPALQLHGTERQGSKGMAPIFLVQCLSEPREWHWNASKRSCECVKKQTSRSQTVPETQHYQAVKKLCAQQCDCRRMLSHESQPWCPYPNGTVFAATLCQYQTPEAQVGELRPTAPRHWPPRQLGAGALGLLVCFSHCPSELDSAHDTRVTRLPYCSFYSNSSAPAVFISSTPMGKSPAAKARSAMRPPTRFRSPARTPAWEFPEPIEEWQPLPYEELRRWYQNHWDRRQSRSSTSWMPRTQASTGKSSSSTWRRAPPQPPMSRRQRESQGQKDPEEKVGQPDVDPTSERAVEAVHPTVKVEPSEPSAPNAGTKTKPELNEEHTIKAELEMGEMERDIIVDKMIQCAKTTAARFGVTSEQLLDAVQLTWLPVLEQRQWRTTVTCLLCSHSPGSLRDWQRHLLTKSHSRIANESTRQR
ncbi:unnamed protein product [Symbiodinium natans]|uniref:Uncharacterized protein n=1 Tax=Symbiodinium natans TaxID=878477 RepID=A0A812IAN1_9DINO|nr:unnamed protein product [Symbiodinium natans]